MPSPARWLLPLEIVAVAAIAGAYAARDIALPVAVPLFVVATASRYARGRTWDDLARGSRFTGLGALVGAVACGLAVLVGTPVVELVDRAVEWSQFPIVRGNPTQLFGVALLVAITAVAAELALRGWLVERARELGARPAVAIALGALAEAVVWPGPLGARLGAALTGAGLGALYLAAGRTLGAPVAARVAFQLVALGLEGLRWIG